MNVQAIFASKRHANSTFHLKPHVMRRAGKQQRSNKANETQPSAVLVWPMQLIPPFRHFRSSKTSKSFKLFKGPYRIHRFLDDSWCEFPPVVQFCNNYDTKVAASFLTTTQAWRNMAMWTKHTVFLYKSFQCKIAAKTQEGFQICW